MMDMRDKFTLLEGEGDPAAIEVIDDAGMPGLMAHVVVPIMRRSKFDRADEKIVGTAFFIAQNVIATAAHVLDDLFDDNQKQVGVAFILQLGIDGQNHIRLIRNICTHTEADICVAQVDPIGLRNPSLPLRSGFPQIGEKVFTYAYPHSKIEHEQDTRHVFLNEKPFVGAVVELFPNGRDTVLIPWPCFRADFHMHKGASGGPVVDGNKRVVGVNSKSYDGQTDISYVTPIYLIEELAIYDVEYNGVDREEVNIRELFTDCVLKYF